MDTGSELDGLRHVLPCVVAARLIEVNVLDELLLPALTHVEDHLVVGAVCVLSRVSRRKRKRAALTGVDGESDGAAARGEVASVGAARRGIVAGADSASMRVPSSGVTPGWIVFLESFGSGKEIVGL